MWQLPFGFFFIRFIPSFMIFFSSRPHRGVSLITAGLHIVRRPCSAPIATRASISGPAHTHTHTCDRWVSAFFLLRELLLFAFARDKLVGPLDCRRGRRFDLRLSRANLLSPLRFSFAFSLGVISLCVSLPTAFMAKHCARGLFLFGCCCFCELAEQQSPPKHK